MLENVRGKMFVVSSRFMGIVSKKKSLGDLIGNDVQLFVFRDYLSFSEQVRKLCHAKTAENSLYSSNMAQQNSPFTDIYKDRIAVSSSIT